MLLVFHKHDASWLQIQQMNCREVISGLEQSLPCDRQSTGVSASSCCTPPSFATHCSDPQPGWAKKPIPMPSTLLHFRQLSLWGDTDCLAHGIYFDHNKYIPISFWLSACPKLSLLERVVSGTKYLLEASYNSASLSLTIPVKLVFIAVTACAKYILKNIFCVCILLSILSTFITLRICKKKS